MLAVLEPFQFTEKNIDNWFFPLPPPKSLPPTGDGMGLPRQISVPVPPPNPIPKVPDTPIMLPTELSFTDLYQVFYYLFLKYGDGDGDGEGGGEMGYEQYQLMDYNTRQNRLQQAKITWCEKLKKGYKNFNTDIFKPNWSVIENDLSLLSEKLSLSTFMLLCFVYKIDLVLVHDGAQIYFHDGDVEAEGERSCILHVAELGGRLYQNKGYTTEKPWRIPLKGRGKPANYRQLTDWNPKWKAIGSYKKNELVDLIYANKLESFTETEKGLTKPELYKILVENSIKNPFVG